MEKSRDKSYNGSYLYKLNEELSGQAEIAPYFEFDAMTGEAPAFGEAGENETAEEPGDGMLSAVDEE